MKRTITDGIHTYDFTVDAESKNEHGFTDTALAELVSSYNSNRIFLQNGVGAVLGVWKNGKQIK